MEQQQVARLKQIKYKKYKQSRRKRELAGEELSTSEDEEGNKKTGYELTNYMVEYNKNTKFDFTQGYDPKSLDEFYKNSKTYDKDNSMMPSQVESDFNPRFSTVQLEK